MAVQQKTRVVEEIIYTTSDGQEFEEYGEAKTHELRYEFTQKYGYTTRDVEGTKTLFFVVNDLAEFWFIRDAIHDGFEVCADIIARQEQLLVPDTFPAAVTYGGDYGDLTIVTEEMYLEASAICSYYEKAELKREGII